MKKHLLIYLLLACAVIALGQSEPDSVKQYRIENRIDNERRNLLTSSQIINKSKYIFEGEVVGGERNYDPFGYVYTQVLIKSVIRGNSSWTGKTVEVGFKGEGSHSFGYGISQTNGVYFCNEMDLPQNSKPVQTDLNLSLSLAGYMGINDDFVGISGLAGIGFNTADEFYDFLGTHSNVNLKSTVYRKKDTRSSQSKSKISHKQWMKYWEEKIRKDQKHNP